MFCLADEGETYAVDESVATCSLEQTNDAAYWISQATFISKDSHMSIDCAHVCETDWMYIRYDDPKKQAMFNGIFSCMNSSNLKRPRWWARWCFRPSRDKNNSALGANAKQTLDSFISSLTLLYFIDLYCASYFYVQYSSHMYDFSFFFFSCSAFYVLAVMSFHLCTKVSRLFECRTGDLGNGLCGPCLFGTSDISEAWSDIMTWSEVCLCFKF